MDRQNQSTDLETITGRSYEWRIESDVSVRILDAMLTHSIMVQKRCDFCHFSLGIIAVL